MNRIPLSLNAFVAGKKVVSTETIEIRSPFDGSLAGTVTLANGEATEQAILAALSFKRTPDRFTRSKILNSAHSLLEARREEFARLITSESGLCIRETRYEVGRSLDVLRFAAIESLHDDGEIFSCDISPQGKARKIYTLREPLSLAAAITPFNHPLNQVVHKVAPAIAAGTPLILKPSERTPLTALRFAELLYEAGLPPEMLSVLVGATHEVAERLVKDERVEVVAFVGSVPVGKKIARIAGYKRLVLELGGNDPLIVLEDADLDLAAHLAAEGSFRNSGQRCTAVKRLLVHQKIAREFLTRFAEKALEYKCGDPDDEQTRVGTVISEEAAIQLEGLVHDAVKRGAKLVLGGERNGALISPTILSDVPRDAVMVVCEAFGPLAPVLEIRDLADAIALANSTAYGLSAGVVTRNLEQSIQAIKGLRCGTVNINEVPGYRLESSPFGGIKDSGLGIKEGVIGTIRYLTNVKTYSLPW